MGLAVVDLGGHIELANRELTALLGRELNELAVLTLSDVVHADDVSILSDRLDLATSTGRRASPVVVRGRLPEERSRWLRVVVDPITRARQVVAFIITVEGVTQSRSIERELGSPRLLTSASPQPKDWIVVLEAEAGTNAMLCDLGTFRAILNSLQEFGATGLHSPDRYALQQTVVETDVGTAFAGALWRWHDVVRPLTPSGWSLVRAEVLTREELDRDLDAQG